MFFKLSRRGREATSAGGDALEVVKPLVNENLRVVMSEPVGDCGGDEDGGVEPIPIPGGLRTPAALLSYHQ